jgi:CDP-glucose 4,6-dehydratase
MATGLTRRLAHVIGDVRDGGNLTHVMRRAAPEIVFHLAAQPLVRQGYREPRFTFETNVLGVVNLFEGVRAVWAAGGEGPRVVVNVTSDKCYAKPRPGAACVEDDALGGEDPYSASKACSELVTAAYRRSYFGGAGAGDAAAVCADVRVATARAGNVIGGGDWAPDRIVPDCVRALNAGRAVEVRNPDAVRPWQHVLESLSGYLWLGARLWDEGAGEALQGAWNFGPVSAAHVTVREVVELFLHTWGGGRWTVAGGATQPRETAVLTLDAGKAERELGWRPVWDVREAVHVTAAWYRGFLADAARRGDAERQTLARCLGDIRHY